MIFISNYYYFHYCRALYEKANNLHLLNKGYNIISSNILSDLYKIPFLFNNNSSIFNEIRKKYKSNDIYENSFNYYTTQWVPYIKNGILYYAYLTKEQRSNSYI